MAKLASHGVQILGASKDLGSNEGCTSRRYDYSVRSDGHILRKFVVYFEPCAALGETTPRRHDYGWKLWRKLKTIPESADAMLRLKTLLEGKKDNGQS